MVIRSRNVVRINVNLLALIAFIFNVASRILVQAGAAVEQSTRIFNMVSPILMTLVLIHILFHWRWFKKLPRMLKN
jgi:hypothetical protein